MHRPLLERRDRPGWWLGRMKLARRWRPIAFDPRGRSPTAADRGDPHRRFPGQRRDWRVGRLNITRALLALPLGASAGAIVAAVATKDLR